VRPLVICIASVALLFAVEPLALADGDPASDALLFYSSFLSPADARMPSSEQASIVQLLANAKAHGFPLKLAVIVTPYDLGADPELFRMPMVYARFLAMEDRYIWQDELLVVMPNGFGVYKRKRLPPADRAAIEALPRPATADGARLGLAAEAAIESLARAHGMTLSTGGSGGSGWVEPAEITGGALVLCGAGFGAWYFLRRRSS
jgi:hypothetical protein